MQMEGRLAAVEKQLEQLLAQQQSKTPAGAGLANERKADSVENMLQSEATIKANAAVSEHDRSQEHKVGGQSDKEQKLASPFLSSGKKSDKVT